MKVLIYMDKAMSTEMKIINSYCNLIKIKNPNNISIKDIIIDAKISKSTFYNYFSTKDSLIEEATNIILDEITQIVNTDLQFNDQVVLELLTYLKNNSNIVDAIRKVQPNIVFTINDYIKDLILHSEIVDFENTLVSKYNLPFKYALTLYVATIQSLITQWMDDDFEEELESVLKYISISIRI